MSDDSNVNVNGEIDAGWSSYWDEEQSQVVGPDRENADANGDVTIEGAPKDGPDSDGSEQAGAGEDPDGGDDDAEVPTWPPKAETVTKIRRRLLNGHSTYDVADWAGASQNSVWRVATAQGNREWPNAEEPPLVSKGVTNEASWVRADDADTDGADEQAGGESGLCWPPDEHAKTEVRARVRDGEPAESVADDLPVGARATKRLMQGRTYCDVPCEIPPLKKVGRAPSHEWVVPDETPDGDTGWPPTGPELDDIRRRLVDGETREEIAGEFPRSPRTITHIATGRTFQEHALQEDVQTPAVHSPGAGGKHEWVWVDRPENNCEQDSREEDVKDSSLSDVTGQRLETPPRRSQQQISRRGVALGASVIAGLVYLLRRWTGDGNSGGPDDE